MDKKVIWDFVKEELSKGKKICLLVVADSSESSPGRQGFLMAVNSEGKTIGTVGGGVLEFKMIQKALKQIRQEIKSRLVVLHHDPAAEEEKSGLICGGTQTIILTLLNEEDKTTIEEVLTALDEELNRTVIIDENGLKLTEANNISKKYDFKYSGKKKYEYSENIGIKDTAYIIGGGHIGLALSRIMKFLNFRVVVFDERKSLFTLEANKFADNKIVTAYENVGAFIPEGDFSYVIIVTAKHTGDRDALKSVINKKLKYIGTMGSKRKIKTIFDSLIQEGIDKSLLQKVHSPIGLDISSETPEEIAISIAAEIIKVKNQK